jgi:CHRD domain-containing protein
MRTRIVGTVAAVGAAAAVLGAGALASGQSGSYGSAQAGKLEKRALFAVLTGKKEVDLEGNRGVGDPDGRGSFTATIDGDQLCFGITVKNIDTPGAAHIHKAPRNEAGDIVVPLTAPSSGDPGASSGCVDVDPELAQAILKHPHKYYANVHTAAFGGGAVRGQLFRKSR